MTLTAAQKQSYDDNGFLVVKGAFTTAELDRMERGVMRAVRAGNCINEEKTYPAPATQYTVEGQYQDDPDLLFVAEHLTVIESVQALLGAPACLSGPQLFSERCYQAFSEPGRCLLPHHGDVPYAEARLIVDHQGKVLLVKCDDGSWQLPGASLSGDDPGSVTAKVMTELEAALTEQHGLVTPWMTYVSDYQTASGMRRVFAYQDDDGLSAGCVSGSGFRWTTADDIRTLAENGELTREDADALRLWRDESFLRGIGETPERARGVSRPAGQ